MSISGLGGSSSANARAVFQPPSFSSLDTNSDSQITLDELKAGAPGDATKSSDKRAEALFKAIDADGDGSITGAEKTAFDEKLQNNQASLAFLAQQISGPSNADVFKATDTNGDGAVSLDELSSDSAATGVSSESLKKLFDLIDSNKDGSISESESSSFLDSVKSAVSQNGPPPPGGGAPGGPGGPPPSQDADQDSDGSSASSDLLALAKNAYSSTSKNTDLISMLQSLLQTAA